MSAARGTCPSCGMTGYLTAAGTVRKHDDKRGGKRRYERETCAGSGKAPRVAK